MMTKWLKIPVPTNPSFHNGGWLNAVHVYSFLTKKNSVYHVILEVREDLLFGVSKIFKTIHEIFIMASLDKVHSHMVS